MHDADPRGRRQAAHRLGCAKRILYLAQMPNHRDIEASCRRGMRRTQRRSRLVHDANLWSKFRRHSPPRKLLQRDETIGARERMQSRHRIAIDIFVDVGAAQSDDQAADPGNVRENPGCCRSCARRGARSSDPPPLHRSGGQLERHGRARAGSASIGRSWFHSRTVTTNGPV